MFRCPHSYSRSNSVLTLLLHPNRSPSLHPSPFPPPLPRCALHPHLTLLFFPPCLLPSFFSGLSPKADGPCKQMLPHPVSRNGKNKAWIQSKQKLLEGGQAGKFTVQLIYDLTIGFSSTGRQEAHRWSQKKKKKNPPILQTHLDALEHT